MNDDNNEIFEEQSLIEISEKHKKSMNGPINKTYTICDIHRQMYRIVNKIHNNKATMTKTEIDQFNYLMERAYHFAKKMNYKLRQYKGGYDDGWYANEANQHKEWSQELRNKK
jgi:hypothetical protein